MTSKISLISLIIFSVLQLSAQYPGTGIIETHGYSGCVELFNGNTRVVLEPNLGGRVHIYELNGKNILYINPEQNGWIYGIGPGFTLVNAGRFDFGPELTTVEHSSLFLGKWDAIITGPREAIMISQEDTVSGIQLVRKFKLDEFSSHLRCTQIIKNISDVTKYHYFWSRTFVKGGGISLVPVNPNSRYPKGYLIYGPGKILDYDPVEKNVRVREGILEITGPPSRPKFVFDVVDGWMGYISKDNQLFIKTFNVYPERVYGDLAGNNASVWYNKDEMCEIEPMGPLETIAPGAEVSFTENWWLFDFDYPENRHVNLGELAKYVNRCK